MTTPLTGTPSSSTGPVRCAIYCRKSHAAGLELEFNSLDAQREAVEDYIAGRKAKGWIALPDRYDDGGISGGTLERPALKRLLADIELGKVDMVLVLKIDRLSRSIRDFGRLMDHLDRHGVAFASTTQPLDTSGPMGKFTLNLLMSFAEFERDIIGERIRDKIALQKRHGKYTGGVPPLGYGIDRGRKCLVVIEEEADLVRKIFRRFVEIRSATQLARELNEQGYRTKAWTSRKGKELGGSRWQKSHLYRVLHDRRYLGQVPHRGEIHEGEHEAIVDQNLWDAVETIFLKTSRNRGKRERAKKPALLKGLLRCGHCNRSMNATFTRKEGRTYRYYVCSAATKGSYQDCPVRSVPAGEVETAVVDQLRALFRSPEIIAGTFGETRVLEDEEVRRLQARQEQLSGSDDLADREELARVEKLLTGLQAEPLTESEVVESLRDLDPIWNELFPVEQARIVGELVEEIEVWEEGLKLKVHGAGLRSLTTELSGHPTAS